MTAKAIDDREAARLAREQVVSALEIIRAVQKVLKNEYLKLNEDELLEQMNEAFDTLAVANFLLYGDDEGTNAIDIDVMHTGVRVYDRVTREEILD